MDIPSRSSVPYLWECDGSFRDIYILPATLDDWRSLLSICKLFRMRYTFDGDEHPLPDLEALFANRDGSHLLAIHLGMVQINCHFFVPDEIELDIDPREIVGDAEHLSVLELIRRLGNDTRRMVNVTPENYPGEPLLSYDPKEGRWIIGGET